MLLIVVNVTKCYLDIKVDSVSTYNNHRDMRYCRESGKHRIILGIITLFDDRIDSFTDSVCNETQTIISLLTLICSTLQDMI